MISFVKSFLVGLYELAIFKLQVWQEKLVLSWGRFKKSLPWLMLAPEAIFAVSVGTLFNDLEPIEEAVDKRLNACYMLLLNKRIFDIEDEEWNKLILKESFWLHTTDIICFPGLRTRLVDKSIDKYYRRIRWDMSLADSTKKLTED